MRIHSMRIACAVTPRRVASLIRHTGWILLAILAAHPASAAPKVPLADDPTIAIVHVNVWPMTPTNTLLRDMTVLIRDGRIQVIGATAGTQVKKGVRRVDGTGKWLMPSLTDMHAHEESARALRIFTGS